MFLHLPNLKLNAYNVHHDTVDVMNSVLRVPELPRADDTLHTAARDLKFSRSQFNPVDGCVGALDGICMKLKKPKNESISDVSFVVTTLHDLSFPFALHLI